MVAMVMKVMSFVRARIFVKFHFWPKLVELSPCNFPESYSSEISPF